MHETPNERVSVLASFNNRPNNTVVVLPHVMKWQGNRYVLNKFGLYHPERRGTKNMHIFSFSSEEAAFRVELDPESLEWKLTGVDYG